MLGGIDRNEAMFEDSWLEAWTDSLVLCLSFSNTGCQTEGIRKFESAVNARFGLFSDNCNILTSVDIHQVVVQSLVRFLALDVDNAGTSGRLVMNRVLYVDEVVHYVVLLQLASSLAVALEGRRRFLLFGE